MTLNMRSTKINRLSGTRKINSRFGEIVINLDNAISFPYGIVGMPGANSFCLTHYPEEKFIAYKLLQSAEDDSLCFLVVPLLHEHYADEESLIAKSDMEKAFEDAGFAKEDAQVILIAAIYNDMKTMRSKVTVNLKAPLIINAKEMIGFQYIFLKDEYPLQYLISE